MSATTEHQSSPAGTNAAHLFSPELLPSLLAALANIDCEHESDLETIRNSSVDEWLRQITIRKLQERHHKRRAPYVRQRAALQKRIRASAA